MTGSSSPEIDAVVTLWNSAPTDQVPDPHAAVVTQLQGDPALVSAIRGEMTRLEGSNGPRALMHLNRPDYISKMHYEWYTAMLTALG